jgi:hypothetical protein
LDCVAFMFACLQFLHSERVILFTYLNFRANGMCVRTSNRKYSIAHHGLTLSFTIYHRKVVLSQATWHLSQLNLGQISSAPSPPIHRPKQSNGQQQQGTGQPSQPSRTDQKRAQRSDKIRVEIIICSFSFDEGFDRVVFPRFDCSKR